MAERIAVNNQSEKDSSITHLRPVPDPATLTHLELNEGSFWQKIAAYRDIDDATFLDHTWQAKNTITKPDKLLKALQGMVEIYLKEQPLNL